MSEFLNIKEDVINQKYGLRYINIKDKEKLNEQLNVLRDNKLLDKYNVTYTYTEHEKYIALTLFRPFDIFSIS